MIKKFFPVVAIALIVASCKSETDKIIDKINSCTSVEQLIKLEHEQSVRDVIEKISVEDQAKINIAAEAKMKELGISPSRYYVLSDEAEEAGL